MTIPKTVVFLMDDKRPIPARRETIAGIIQKALKDGARAVVLDMYFPTTTKNDASLTEALKKAKNAGMPVFMGASPEEGQPSQFKDIAIHGHGVGVERKGPLSRLLDLFSDGDDQLPNPTWMQAQKTFNGRSYYALPLIAAAKLRGLPTNLKMERGEPTDLIPSDFDLHYKDRCNLSPKAYSYRKYGKVSTAGAVVFVGGSVTPLTGKPVDVVKNDCGERTHGVFDIVSAFLTYYDRLPQHTK